MSEGHEGAAGLDDASAGIDAERQLLDDPSAGIDAERQLLDDPSRVREDGVVDARGLRCPAPIILLARAARDAPDGTMLEVWWTDPAAETDIGAWARMRGHQEFGTEPLSGASEVPGAPADDSFDEPPAARQASAFATRVRLTPP